MLPLDSQVLSHFDDDADGVVNVDHVLKVIELLGTEHVKMSADQIGKITDMLQKEEMLKMESDIERILNESDGDGGATQETVEEKERRLEETIQVSGPGVIIFYYNCEY